MKKYQWILQSTREPLSLIMKYYFAYPIMILDLRPISRYFDSAGKNKQTNKQKQTKQNNNKKKQY